MGVLYKRSSPSRLNFIRLNRKEIYIMETFWLVMCFFPMWFGVVLFFVVLPIIDSITGDKHECKWYREDENEDL